MSGQAGHATRNDSFTRNDAWRPPFPKTRLPPEIGGNLQSKSEYLFQLLFDNIKSVRHFNGMSDHLNRAAITFVS